MTRAIRSVNRRARMTWRRLRAGLVDTRVSRADLATALGVAEQALEPRVAEIRDALARRLPGAPFDADALRRAYTVGAPDQLEQLRAQADIVAGHTFNLLGSGPMHLGDAIDWHCDFKSGYRWDPAAHYTSIRFGNTPNVDVKCPWELSRGQHLPLLAQAYLLTGSARYADEAVHQTLDWIDANPPEFGVNWACPMDVAIRAVNWIWMAGLLSSAREVGHEFFEALLGSVLAHTDYLWANLEIPSDGIRTNHYIADLLGLFYIGTCLPELDPDGACTAFGRSELEREIQQQVLADGASYESSIPYHRLVTEMFLSAALLARQSGRAFDAPYLDRLRRMLEFTAAYTKPNGLAPQIGDADDGRLHVLTGYGVMDPRDHRHLLAGGAALFGRDDWRALSGECRTEGWWLGAPVTTDRTTAKPPSPASVAFERAGLYILRARNDVVFFTAGTVGTDGLGSHKHNDLLAIEVHLDGEDLLVDPGTYVYTPDPVARNEFRSTRAHNTVMVDQAEQNRIPAASLFSLHPDATPRVISWSPGRDGGSVCAEHDGYCRLPAPVIHRRGVSLATGGCVAVEDTFTSAAPGAAPHRLCWTFAFAPGCGLSENSDQNGWVVTSASGRRFCLTAPHDAAGSRVGVSAACEQGQVSPSYGVRRPASIVRWIWEGPLPIVVNFQVSTLR